MTDHNHADHAPHDHAGHAGHADDAELAELLDLDAEVLRGYWTAVLTSVRDVTKGTGRILDLGAGTGTGTIALAQRFGSAEVLAVDASEQMLRRIRAKALDLGLAQRVRTVQADLDGPWPAIEPVDITWASMSMHHLADPDRVLADVFTTTGPDGLVVVIEMDEPVRFLPEDVGIGRPGLEKRCLDALEHEHARSVPELGSHWAPRLETAGFTVLSERTLPIELDPPHPPAAVRYAQLWLRRLASGVAQHLAQDDRDTLAALVDGDGPESLQQRDDLQIRGSRTVTIARRP